MLYERTKPLSIASVKENIKRVERKYQKGKLILGSQHLRSDDFYKIRVGLALEAGESLIGFQHGGDDYGLSKHCEEIRENEFKSSNDTDKTNGGISEKLNLNKLILPALH